MVQSIKANIPLKGLSTGKSSPKIEAIGFTGETCRTATARFIAALGGGSSVEETKPEIYETESANQHVESDV